MEVSSLDQLRFFSQHERDLSGRLVDWSGYDFATVQELDRLRYVLGSPCILIRGGKDHGFGKDSAVDAVFPKAPYGSVVMACMRSGLSKGFYEGGSIHLDSRMGINGLARCWVAFKENRAPEIADLGLRSLFAHAGDGWDYYKWQHVKGWALLKYLVELNEAET